MYSNNIVRSVFWTLSKPVNHTDARSKIPASGILELSIYTKPTEILICYITLLYTQHAQNEPLLLSIDLETVLSGNSKTVYTRLVPTSHQRITSRTSTSYSLKSILNILNINNNRYKSSLGIKSKRKI